MGKKEGKKRISIDELTSLRNAGWRFRIKTVKGKRYISARKGKEEKGIAPFSEELWGEIHNLTKLNGDLKEEVSPKESNEEIENLQNQFKILKEALQLMRSAHMARFCLFKDRENFCEYWQWSEEPRAYSLFTKLLGENIFRVVRDEATGLRRWAIRASEFTCAGCPAFR